MADFNYQVQPSTATGLISGVTAGMNAATLIQENRMRRQQMDANAKKAKDDEERLKMTDGLALMKEKWVPGDYKLQLYKSNVQPYFEARGKPLGELAEWKEGYDKLAKSISTIYEKAPALGTPPDEVERMVALEMSKFEKEERDAAMPFLDTLKGQREGKDKLAVAEKTTENKDRDFEMKQQKQRTSIIDKFNADPNVRKSTSIMESARSVRTLATSNNPIAQNMVPTMLGKLSGDVGNLPEGFKEELKGDKSILSEMERLLQRKATGKPLTPTDVAYMQKVAGMLEAGATENRRLIARDRAGQLASTGVLDEETIFNMLMPASKAAPAAAPTGTGKKIGRFDVTVEP